TLRLRRVHQFVSAASGPFFAIRNNAGNGRQRNSERLDQARRFLPFSAIASRLGQCSDASLGPVTDVSKPRILSMLGFETQKSDIRGQTSAASSRKLGGNRHADQVSEGSDCLSKSVRPGDGDFRGK